MMEEEEESLEKYVKLSVEELVTLRDSYNAKIRSKVENHWLTKLESRTKRNISNYLLYFAIILFVIGFISMVIIMLIVFFNRNNLSTLNSSFFWLTPFMFSFMGGGFILQAMDDGTRKDRRDLRAIELVLDKKNPSPKKIMFDSNIFDEFESGKITFEDIDKAKKKGFRFYITSIQYKEINDISDKEKREKLFLFIGKINPEIVSTESTSLGLSRLGLSKFSDGELIKQLDNDNPKRRKDALIAETALKNDYILVTNDLLLIKGVTRFGGRSYSIEDFLRNIQ